MSIVDFLTDLRRAGIQLSLNEDKLKIKAPSGALTPQIKAELKAKKEDIIAFLKQASSSGGTSIPRIDRDQPLPLSFNQEGLWFIDQFKPGSAAYNMPIALKLTGNLNTQALQRSLTEITKRHEILRSRFIKSEDGEPSVVIDPETTFSLAIESFPDVSIDDEKAILKLVTEDALKPFDLVNGPLFRVRLLQLAQDQGKDAYLLLGGMHHIISDGWSQKILMQELGILYSAYAQGCDSPLPELPIQFVDYAAWQRDFLQGENLEKHLQYWRDELADVANVLSLPTDNPRPAVQTSHGAVYRFDIEAETAARLQRIAAEKGATQFTVLMAAWQLVLAKYAQQDSFCVGIPMLGRSQKETEGLIGFFINALLIKADINGNPNVADFIERVKSTVLGAFEHQQIPLQLIIDDRELPRSLSHQPMAQVGFQLLDHSQVQAEQAASEQANALADLKMETLASEEVVAKYDMILSLSQYPDKLKGEVEYNRDLYSQATIAKMMDHFKAAVDFICGDQEQPIAALTFVSEQELRQVLGVSEQDRVLPLTSSQKMLFLDAVVNPDSVQNATGYFLPINSKLDVAKLQTAIDHVTSQFGILRTSFHRCDLPYGDPGYQVVHPERKIPFQQISAAGKQRDDVLKEIEDWVYQPCDVFKDPLYAARLYSFNDTEFLLAVSGHHLVIDGVTYENHARHVAATYDALLKGGELPTWTDNFAEYIAWDNAQVDSQAILSYWRDQLANVEPLSYTVSPSKQISNADYRIAEERFSADESAAIRAYCEQHKIHPSDLFRLVCAYLVKLYCRPEKDFVLYEQQAGRRKHNFTTLGVFYQQLPFVVPQDRLAGNLAIDEFYEFELAQKKSAKSYRPLSMFAQREMIGTGRLFFQFNYYTFMAQIRLGDSEEYLGINSPRPENAVQLIIKDEPQLLLNLMYETQVFQEDGFLSRVRQLVNQVVTGQATQIGQLSPLMADEHADLESWSSDHKQAGLPDTVQAYPTIVEWFEAQVDRTPDSTAVVCGEASLSYRAFNEYINQVAHWLQQEGVEKGDKVAIAIGRSVEMLASVWATIKLGAAYIPIDIAYPKERIRYIADDSSAKCLLTENCLLNEFGELCEKVLVPTTAQVANYPKTNPAIALCGDDQIYTIYTSGSTGKPKGAAVKHSGERNLMAWYTGANEETGFALTESDRLLLISAFGFDLTQKNLYAPFLVGATLVLPESNVYDVSAIQALIATHRITWINCAPSAFYPLVEDFSDEKAQQLKSLRWLFLGGEPIALGQLSDWLQHSDVVCQLVNSYGPTECTDVVAYHVLQSLDLEQTVPIGRAIANVTLHILDDNLCRVPTGFVGELCIAGDCVGAGYLNRDELTQSVFVANPYGEGKLYKTGDLARFKPDGTIEYIGRKDYQVKLRGLRIELSEIEFALEQLEGVRDSLVLVTNDQLVAYVLAPQQLVETHWRETLADFLPDYMLPSCLICMDHWPLTPNGKIDRKALPDVDKSFRLTPYVAPRNELEEKIAGIWAQVLNVDEVGVNDNFFDLGGHSLLATKIASRIRRELDKELQLHDLLSEPTVAALAQLLMSENYSKSSLPPIEPSNLTEAVPLSLGQQRLWFFEQMNPGSVANNMPAAVRLKGDLDLVALQQAFAKLIERHASLRSRFFMGEDGEPKQTILESVEPDVEVVDLSTDSDKEKSVMGWVAKDRALPFDLTAGSLLRVKILVLGEQHGKREYVLLLCMHHIISDGVSINILLQELITLYYAFANNLPSPLPPLTIQYSDYAVWQREHLQGELLDNQIEYWECQLAKPPKMSTFPTDKPRPRVQTTNGANFQFELGEDFLNKLNDFCREQGLTSFMFLFSVWSLLISRYNANQEDVCVGIPTAGRDQPELEPLIGFFINSMVLRTDLSGNPSALEYLERVKSTVLEGFANSDVPFEMVLERLPLERNMSFTPLVQTAFQMLINDRLPSSELTGQSFAGLELEPVAGEGTSAKFDMLLTVSQSNNRLLGTLEYNTDLFFESTISRLTQQFVRLAEYIIDDCSHAVSNYQLYTQAELKKLPGVEHQSVARVMPLTTTQQAFLMNLQINPDTVQYSVGYAYEIRRAIQPDIFKKALQAVTDQFVALRTEFHRCDLPGADLAYQVVLEEKPVVMGFETIELDCEVDERQWHLRPVYENWVYRSYDVWNDDLVVFKLIKVAEDHYFYLFRGHHIVLDGIAGRSMLDKTLDTYLALECGELAPKYDDLYPAYVIEHNDKMDKSSVAEFWREELAEVEPLDFSKPPLFANDGQYHVLYHGLSEEKTKQIKQYCRKQRIHPSIYFRYLSAVMLTSYCRAESDFVVYEIQSGRGSGHEDALGVYYQQVPFHYQKALFEKQAEPKAFYAQQKAYRKKLRGHTDISLALQDQFAGHGRIGFQYNYFNFIQSVPFGDLAATPDVQSSHVEDTVQVFIKEFDDTFNLELWYDGAVFTPLDFLPRMEQLSDQLCGNAVERFADFNFLLPEEEKDYSAWQGETVTPSAYNSVVDWFEAQVGLTPDATAVVCGDRSLSYSALNTRANQLAYLLQAKGICQGDRVAICLERSVAMLEAIIGVLKLGASYVPIEVGYPQERIDYMVADSSAKVVITQATLEQRFSKGNTICLMLDQLESSLADQPQDNPGVPVGGDDAIYTIYTSGSTGQPKGAEVLHKGELNLQQWYIKEAGLGQDDRVLIISAFGFDLTQKNFFAPLLSGGTIVLPETEGYDPAAFNELITQHRVTLLNCAPSAFYPLIEFCNKDYSKLESLRQVWLGGEPIRMDDLMDWYAKTEAQLVNSYGPTECTDVVAAYCIPKSYRLNDVVPIGSAIDNVAIHIVNDSDQLCPPGLIGEICISGICVGAGYLNQSELTASVFTEHPITEGQLYRTGDLGRYLPNGKIEYIGRKDFQVKLRGLRIELGEIETALKSLEEVRDALILVHNETLVAYTLADNESDISEWRAALREQLPDYMIPTHIITLAEWPLTPNGKVDRSALPEPSSEARVTAYVAPRNATEKSLQEIWQAVLDIDEIGVKDNFFEIGGHSILGVRVIARIDQVLGINLQAIDLLNNQTIEKLAGLIMSKGEEQAFSPIVTLKDNQAQGSLFFIHPIGGDVLCYRELAQALDFPLNIYGLRCRGMDLADPPYSSLDEMVGDYVNAVLAVADPSEPIVLAGQSLGGILALALSEALAQKGIKVKKLAMLDTYAPQHLEQYFGDEVDMVQSALGIELPEQIRELKQANPDQWLMMLYNMMKNFGEIGADLSFERISAIYQVAANNVQFSAHYRVPWDQLPEIIHFSAEESKNHVKADESWRSADGFIATPFTFNSAPGDHESIMRGENATSLADTLSGLLTENSD